MPAHLGQRARKRQGVAGHACAHRIGPVFDQYGQMPDLPAQRRQAETARAQAVHPEHQKRILAPDMRQLMGNRRRDFLFVQVLEQPVRQRDDRFAPAHGKRLRGIARVDSPGS